MTFRSPDKGGRQSPPPSSPADGRRQSGRGNINSHHQQQHRQAQHQRPSIPQQQIGGLVQYAQTSYTTNPTDALSALMDALTLSTGTNAAAQLAMDRIRSELGDTVADCIAGNVSGHPMQRSTYQQNDHHSLSSASGQLSDAEMTLKAMEVVQRMLDDTSTILYSQGRQHLLQQAMEDGSSVVCSKCGEMIARARWRQHVEYWCCGREEEKGCEGEDSMALGD